MRSRDWTKARRSARSRISRRPPGAELRRRLPGVRELQPGGDWKLELDELRRGSALAGWLLLAALLLWGVDSYLGKEAAR